MSTSVYPLQNPYVHRSAIDTEADFFGRTAELKSIYSRIIGGQSVYLIGERRVGKSSILNALDFPTQRERFGIEDDFTFVKIDLQFIAGCTEQTFLENLLTLMTEALGITLQSADRRGMELAGRDVKRSGHRLTILLDEFDVLVTNDRIPADFLAFLRSWSARMTIPFVGAFKEGSTQRLAQDEKAGSAFLNIFGVVYVGALERAEAHDLITMPARCLDVHVSDEEIARVVQLAGYFALHLQIACYHLLELKWAGLTGSQLAAALEQKFAFEAMPHFDYLLNVLPAAERFALSRIVEAGTVDAECSKELERKGILITEHGRQRIFSTVFADLIRRRAVKKTAGFFSRFME